MALMVTRPGQPPGSLPNPCTTVKALARHQTALTVYFVRLMRHSKLLDLHLEKPNVHHSYLFYLHHPHHQEFQPFTNIPNPCRCPRAFKNIRDGEGKIRLQLHLNDHHQTEGLQW